MGRKIPGKRHRGVKDPLKQQARREAELEGKVNAPPKDVDEQAVPRSLERVVQLKEAVKSGRIAKTKRKRKKHALICVGGAPPGNKPSHPKARPEKVVPVFQQKPGEHPQRFLHRVCEETHAFLNETAFEKKYRVQIQRNPETGDIEGLAKCKKGDLDEIEKLRAKHKNIKKKKNKPETPIMTKAQKRKEKLRLKKEKKKSAGKDEFNDLHDDVKFGEIVHAPPTLKTRPRKADPTDSSKPGRKSLLLHSLLENDNAKSEVSKKPVIDRSGKRKNLPVGERRQLEKQQSDIIAAYRRLKAQRSSANT